MLRSGWDGRKGLGPEGQGQRYPVKTILKKDRKCLGSLKEEKPKITHFNANEKKAIQRNPERKLYEIFSDRTKIGDLLIQVTTWTGLTVYFKLKVRRHRES
jgi:hypothetical protein